MDTVPPRLAWARHLYRTTDWTLLWHSGVVAALTSAAVIILAHLHG